MFIVLFLPLSALDQIYAVSNFLYGKSNFYSLLVVLLLLLWLFSFYFLIKSVVAFSSPAHHVSGAETLRGVFYDSSLYRLGLIDAFSNYPIKSVRTVDETLLIVPVDEQSLLRELVFEKMKLVYIRDVKIYRSSLCILLSFFWLLGGISLWVLHKILGA